MVNKKKKKKKNNNNNSSNSMVFGRWPQTKISFSMFLLKLKLDLKQKRCNSERKCIASLSCIVGQQEGLIVLPITQHTYSGCKSRRSCLII